MAYYVAYPAAGGNSPAYLTIKGETYGHSFSSEGVVISTSFNLNGTYYTLYRFDGTISVSVNASNLWLHNSGSLNKSSYTDYSSSPTVVTVWNYSGTAGSQYYSPIHKFETVVQYGGAYSVNLTERSYNGSDQVVATMTYSSGTGYLGFGANANITNGNDIDWANPNTSLYAKDIDTYYVYSMYTPPGANPTWIPNYEGTVQIVKGSQAAPTAYGDTTTYGNTAVATASGGGGHGLLQWTNGYTRTAVGSQKTKAFWPGDSNYNASPYSNEVTLTINKASQAAPTVTSSSSTYGNSVTGGYSGGGGQGTLYYRADTNGGTNYGAATTSAPTRSTLGTTTYIAYWGGNSNYNVSPNSNQGVLTIISKSAGYVNTAPTNNGVTYNSGSYLCSAGSNASGTIYYSLSYSTGYSQTRPTATSDLNAGSYTVYYYAAESTNYEQSQIYSVAVTIVKAPYPHAFGISPTSATIYNTSGYNTVRITPSNDYSSVSYSSSNSSVATVTTTSSKYGDVTYKAAGTAYIYATASGGTNYEDAYATCTITCTEDYIVNYDYAPSGYWARLTIGSGLRASGGSAGVTATGGHNYYYLYASGYSTGPYSTDSDGASWSITYDNNSRFYKRGNYLYHYSMGTTETTDYVTITATNGSGSVDANRSITNSLESISLSVSKNPISYDESTTCSVSATYTSGDSIDVTSSAEISVGTSGIVTIS